MALRLDYTNMMAPPIDGGITDAEWRAADTRFADAHAAVVGLHGEGTLGFLDLPDDRALHRQTVDYVERARPPQWNLLDDAARGGFPRLHVLDNVDPANITALLARLDLRKSLFIVTSKSGGTAETMAQYLVVRGRLSAELGDDTAKERIVFVTDPTKGALRAIAGAERIATLDIPANVGGRFSVLTPVGVLPPRSWGSTPTVCSTARPTCARAAPRGSSSATSPAPSPHCNTSPTPRGERLRPAGGRVG
ncbi:MAG: hypothetical protein M3Z10_00050 [Gemmatimonadota bacterium]|nr:hypothetical protein [Gemmatimonadota bacterium]